MITKENVEVELHLGGAGSGKSFTIAKTMIDYAKNNAFGVIVVVPTSSAKQNLISTLWKFKDENAQLIYNLIDNIQIKYLNVNTKSDLGLLMFDEIGLMTTSDLHSSLDKVKQQKTDLKIQLYGDATQLVAPKAPSIIQGIIEYNFETRNSFIWAHEHPYDSIEWKRLYLPDEYGFGSLKINVFTHMKNYRFQQLDNLSDYTGYSDPKFMNDLIDSAHEITHNTEIDDQLFKDLTRDYQNYVSNLIINYNVPVIVPTNAIIDEVNDGVKAYCKSNNLKYSEVSMFVHVNGDNASQLYINPDNEHVELLKTMFAFDVADRKKDFEYRNAMTVHSVQGQTFNSVAYYLGAHQIPTKENIKKFFNLNQFYTAISRSKKYFYLIGEKHVFRSMLEIFPDPVKIVPKDDSASRQAVLQVIDGLNSMEIPDVIYNSDTIYDQFLVKYNEIPNKPTMSKQYTKTELLRFFKYYEVPKDGFRRDYRYLWDSHISKERQSAGQRGDNGKNQKWLKSLTDEQLTSMKDDLSSRKVKPAEFEGKYGKTKKQVRDILK